MTLESRLANLITSVGADARNMKAVPSYAGPDTFRRYNPDQNVYNARSYNLAKSRIALAKAASGTGKFNLLTVGDSALIGFNGSTTTDRFSVPKQIALNLAQLTGAPVDAGLVTVPSAANTLSDRIITSGTVYSAYPFLMLYAGSTVTYETEQAGTDVWIYYTDNSAAWSYSIDGAASVNVPALGGSGGSVKVTVSGLSDTTHRIVITAPSNYVYISAFQVSKATGISSHNLAFGGSRAGVSATVSWTDGSAGTSLKMAREILRGTTGFPVPDCILIGIGGNDMLNDDPWAAAIDDIRVMRNWWPNADVILTGGVFFSGSNATNVANYSKAKYALAEELDAVYFDERDFMHDGAFALAQGALGPDNAHPINGMSTEFARKIAEVIAGSGSLSPQPIPQTIHLKTIVSPVLSAALAGQFIRCDYPTAQGLYVPTQATAAIPIGSVFEGMRYGAGDLTIVASGGVTIRSSAGLKVNGQYGVFGLRKIGLNEWVAYGDLTT